MAGAPYHHLESSGGFRHASLLLSLRFGVAVHGALLLQLRINRERGRARHQLVRPHVGRQIAGVCIALAQAYSWDVAIVRIFTVLGFFFSGGLVGVAYLAGWIGIPEEPFPMPGQTPPQP